MVVALVALGLASAACGEGDTSDGATCGDDSADAPVFAASSLAEPFEEIWEEMLSLDECPPAEEVSFNFAGSQELRIQIVESGSSSFYAFASADRQQMDLAIEGGGVGGEPHLFARNRLVVIVPENNEAEIETLQDLAADGVKIVLADEAVPAGAYARAFLENSSDDSAFGEGYADAVLDNVVSNEPNVRQVIARVQLAEVDAGIVYATDAMADLADDMKVIAIPDELNETAEYWIARREELTGRGWVDFVDYVLSDAGQDILEEHGFIRVDR
ncbi:MAG TPA: molybdate ABC transporter substrate-binding protein [Dehalococcoidia bacterium]|nr:molybdate ABC transporter substrate-binding protein [Dehalococcoidia bacterium]